MRLDKAIEPMETLRLDADFTEALKKMDKIEEIRKKLPGLDCGSCGAPTCMAFAEDIVKGETNADECVVHMRMLFHDYLEKRRGGNPGDVIPLEKWMRSKQNTDDKTDGGNV